MILFFFADCIQKRSTAFLLMNRHKMVASYIRFNLKYRLIYEIKSEYLIKKTYRDEQLTKYVW